MGSLDAVWEARGRLMVVLVELTVKCRLHGLLGKSLELQSLYISENALTYGFACLHNCHSPRITQKASHSDHANLQVIVEEFIPYMTLI